MEGGPLTFVRLLKLRLGWQVRHYGKGRGARTLVSIRPWSFSGAKRYVNVSRWGKIVDGRRGQTSLTGWRDFILRRHGMNAAEKRKSGHALGSRLGRAPPCI